MRANVYAMRAMSARSRSAHQRACIDAVEQYSSFVRREHWPLPFFTPCLGPRQVLFQQWAWSVFPADPLMKAATSIGLTVARANSPRPSHQSLNLHAAL